MTRTITALTIALLISAGTEAEAQKKAQNEWSGKTVETSLVFLMEAEDFNRNLESSEPGYYYTFEALYSVPQITQWVLLQGNVDVHRCFYDIEEDSIGMCWPFQGFFPGNRNEINYAYLQTGIVLYVNITEETLRQASAVLRKGLGKNQFLRVTVSAPAEE